MKIHIICLFLSPALIAALGLMLTGRVTAQTFTTLHDFTTVYNTSYNIFSNCDGAYPVAPLILSGNTLYGTATYGGTNGTGIVFAINTDGTGFTNLHTFGPATFDAEGNAPNGDGADPEAGLILSGNTLYGTATVGGTNGNGTVFSLNTNGTGFTVLHTFSQLMFNGSIYVNMDGIIPSAPLILSGNTLYGTAGGGANGYGTVFSLSTNGTNFTVLHTFSLGTGFPPNNSDGAFPGGALILSGNTLYGVASEGGTNTYGTVFSLNTDGTGFTNLYNFTDGSDGSFPGGALILSGNTLYGTAANGGTGGAGTVFALSTNGTNFTTLHTFTTPGGPDITNYDGSSPVGSLILSGNTLYGAAIYGGTNGVGTVFALSTNGTGFTTLSAFNPLTPSLTTLTNSDGANPWSGLILSGNTLYGTAENGGNNGAGTVFGLTLGSVSSPQLTIIGSGTNVILTWSAIGFTLQSATNLAAPVWITVPGQNAVTNPISGTQKFYRLSQ
jgi:uncharacterized repeat protein (TIGR03803 family)